jgi:2-iminobutanoate/2-iminopropanoate deaminase
MPTTTRKAGHSGHHRVPSGLQPVAASLAPSTRSTKELAMTTTPRPVHDVSIVNPWDWQDALGYSQAVVVENTRRTLYAAGQCSIDAAGVPQHPGDMAGQVQLAMDNVETVLAAGGMSLADVVRLDVYTTDIAQYFEKGHALVAGRCHAHGRVPAGGILAQVGALAMPPLLVEIVVTAAR